MGQRARAVERAFGAGGTALSLLLLDSTFLIDADRQADDLEALIADDDDVAIAAITVAELLLGVALADDQRRPDRQRFVDGVTEVIPVLSYDVTVARAHAQLLGIVRRAGRPRGAHDLIIAATAAASQRIVVAADARGFADLPGVTVRSHR